MIYNVKKHKNGLVISGLIIIILSIVAAWHKMNISDYDVDYVFLLVDLYGGIPYGYKLADEGIPFNYLIFVIQYAVVAVASMFEAGGCMEVTRQRIGKRWTRQIVYVCGLVIITNILNCLGVFLLCLFKGIAIDLSLFPLFISKIILDIFPVIICIMLLLILLGMIINSVITIFIYLIIMLSFMAAQNTVPVIDHLMLYRIGLNSNFLGAIPVIIAGIMCGAVLLAVGRLILKRKDYI